MNPMPDLDERLDEALEESFPASDPPAVHAIDPQEKPSQTPALPEPRQSSSAPAGQKS
ncbi:MAG TPA: hypothetical protein VK696_03910 [Steroidobacteraceae bacterium]|jgi:hypothetical protein|nr:hypothetical protein [Steroidobacteraceae bacterium]